jgi:hypothetical protein
MLMTSRFRIAAIDSTFLTTLDWNSSGCSNLEL